MTFKTNPSASARQVISNLALAIQMVDHAFHDVKNDSDVRDALLHSKLQSISLELQVAIEELEELGYPKV